MSPRTGRPPMQGGKKDTTVRLRMSASEIETLDDCVKKTKGTRSSVLLEGLRLLKSALEKEAK
ncbi:MAG: hypothetical protein IJ461_00070 [Clostridia bacterium]|nr:hypothetical protein [Clostridia bacterium]